MCSAKELTFTFLFYLNLSTKHLNRSRVRKHLKTKTNSSCPLDISRLPVDTLTFHSIKPEKIVLRHPVYEKLEHPVYQPVYTKLKVHLLLRHTCAISALTKRWRNHIYTAQSKIRSSHYNMADLMKIIKPYFNVFSVVQSYCVTYPAVP